MKLVMLIAVATWGLAQTEYRGTLGADLFIPGGLYEKAKFTLAATDQRTLLGDLAKPSDRVLVGQIRESLAYFVEPATLFVDLNADGHFTAQEKYDLSTGLAEVRFPLPGPTYQTYPVNVSLSSDGTLAESSRAFVRGAVSINGRIVTAGFAFDWKKNAVSPNDGWQGFDGEYSFVKDERPVYHVGGVYARVGSVVLERREFVLDAASAADYDRIELKIGEIFPDFSFLDLAGETHRLPGGGVLLDFWATWCAPCIADLPRLRELDAQGVRVIGMNVDRDQNQVRAMNLPWPQAEFSSIRDLVERRARIQSYPTYVLLDRDRHILAVGEAALDAALKCDRCDPSNWLPPGH
jgi:thiol-disulfide isomerase/thioredoxin